ncbi:hypothetical protein H4R27_000489 [Coemansia aciculifera]|nr:hypothetical protein H4R27_000489 [Coemansia aciculifera]
MIGWKASWSLNNVMLGIRTTLHHLARELVIELNKDDVYSGEALQMLSRSPYDGCAFPLVRKITFTIGLGDNIQTKQAVVATNISAFVQRIKQMAPMAKTFMLSPLVCGHIKNCTGQYFDDLATQLFRLVGHIEYGFINKFSDIRELQLDEVHNLVSIEHITYHSIDTFIGLARLNAATLEYLHITPSKTNGAIGIIQDANGAYVIYPCLTTLFLGASSADFNVSPPVFEDIVPFPSLRHLEIPPKYPFCDDVLFRGNAATLKCLELTLSRSTAAMLREYSVFTLQSHPSLRCVYVGFDNHSVPGAFATKAEALKFVLGIGARASERYISIPVTGAELIGVTPSLTNHAVIQVLSLYLTTLDLWQAITLIKSLPLLVELSTMTPDIGTLPNGIALDDLPAYVVSTFAPIGTRLEHWPLISSVGEEEDSLKRVLLLALVCPNFWHVSSYVDGYDEPSEMLEVALASDIFKPYAPRLQHIRFHRHP